MLDEQDGEALLGLDRAQRLGQRRRLGAVEARRRLVEQQQPGLGHQRPADLDEPSLAEAEPLDRLVGEVGEPEQLEHLVAAGDLVGPGPPAADRGPSRTGRRRRRTRSAMSRCSRTVRVGEQLDALERAPDAAPGPLVHGEPGDVVAVELDGAAVAAEHPEQAVEERRLAGAVRADEADPLALVDVDVDAVERDDAGEPLRHVPRPAGRSLTRPAPLPGPTRPRWRARRRAPTVRHGAAARRAARSADRRLRASTMPSGWRANWMAPRPNRTNRHFGEIGKMSGDPVGAAQDPAEEGALQDRRGRTARTSRAACDRALDRAGAERDDEHEPEQGGERREVVAVVHVLLLHRQQGAAEPGDERRDGEGEQAGPGRRDADRLRRHLAAAQRPQRAARRCPSGAGRPPTPTIDEHDQARTRNALSLAKSHGPITGRGTGVP